MAFSKPTTIKLNVDVFTKPAFYIMYMPLGMPYEKVLHEAKANFEVNEDFGVIEKNKLFGVGWIGASVNNPEKNSKNYQKVEGEFRKIEVTGPYKQLMKIDPLWKADKSEAKEFYLIYKNTPKETAEEDLVTWFVYR